MQLEVRDVAPTLSQLVDEAQELRVRRRCFARRSSGARADVLELGPRDARRLRAELCDERVVALLRLAHAAASAVTSCTTKEAETNEVANAPARRRTPRGAYMRRSSMRNGVLMTRAIKGAHGSQSTSRRNSRLGVGLNHKLLLAL